MLIAHLSDLHICDKFKEENSEKTERIIERAVENGIDHLVITGDISDNADPKDYNTLRNILAKFNLLDASKTSIVIGNHDIFGGVRTALDVVNFPSRCRTTDYDEKVKQFVHHFSELFEQAYFPIKDKFFPYAKIISDTVFVGLNSIDRFSKLKNPFASNGKVGKEQKEGIKKIFENETYKNLQKIILIHHHFYKRGVEATASQNSLWNKIESFTLNLRGKKKLISLFNELEVNMVLHGHSHEVKEYFRKGLRFLNAGAVIDNADPEMSKLMLVRTSSELIYTWSENIAIEKYNKELDVECVNIKAELA
jgi:3',5'-cyclic-AMP phosphodiesterase